MHSQVLQGHSRADTWETASETLVAPSLAASPHASKRSILQPLPVFCCGSAYETFEENTIKLHHDENHFLHEAIYRSFVAFTVRRQNAADLDRLIKNASRPCEPLPKFFTPPTLPAAPEPTFMHTPLVDNPLNAHTPYVVHVTARHDYGPVYSHRYFICPEKLEDDWVEISLLEWFCAGAAFKLAAERWDLKCLEDDRFFRMTLRPNLDLRGCYVPREWREAVDEATQVDEAEERQEGCGSGCCGRVVDV